MAGGHVAGEAVASVLRRLPDGVSAQVVAASMLGQRLESPTYRTSFPVVEPLAPLLPGGGLRRGSVVVVRGSVVLLFALVAAATAQGAWAAVVGLDDLGVSAAAETGVAVHRLALVPRPGPHGTSVLAALLDGVGLVALAGTDRVPPGARRSLEARTRQRGAVLLPFGRWPGADLELECSTRNWHGAEDGYGRLSSREVVVHAVGRGAAARTRTVRLLLPGPGGPAVRLGAAGSAQTVRAVG